MHFNYSNTLAIGFLVFATALSFTHCASQQSTSSEQVGRYIENNPEKIWNATLEILNAHNLQIVSKNQDDPKVWLIDTAFKKISTRQMRKYARSRYGYKPNIITYMQARYKLEIVIEATSTNSCSIAIKFKPELLASGTSDYAGQWESGTSTGAYENELYKSILTLAESK